MQQDLMDSLTSGGVHGEEALGIASGDAEGECELWVKVAVTGSELQHGGVGGGILRHVRVVDRQLAQGHVVVHIAHRYEHLQHKTDQ